MSCFEILKNWNNMKNKYLLKSSINNAHKIICQDNSEIILERIDTTFAKLFCLNMSNNSNHVNGILSHVKGLNLLSKKSLFVNYSNDEAIKKYNQKANAHVLSQDSLNEAVLHEQKEKTEILSKYLTTTQTKPHIYPQRLNRDFFDMANNKDFAKQDKAEFTSNLAQLEKITSHSHTDATSSKQFTSTDSADNSMFLTLVNPYKFRDYSITIPEYITLILHITPKSQLFVYCPLDLNSPLEYSEVNYLFPIVFNAEKKLAAQIPLSIMDYPDFTTQTLRDYL